MIKIEIEIYHIGFVHEMICLCIYPSLPVHSLYQLSHQMGHSCWTIYCRVLGRSCLNSLVRGLDRSLDRSCGLCLGRSCGLCLGRSCGLCASHNHGLIYLFSTSHRSKNCHFLD